jgi:hypothetical protein
VLAQCLDPGVAEDMPDRYTLLPSLARLALAAGDTATAAAAARAAAAETEREPLPVKTAAAGWCEGLAASDPVLAAAAYYESAGRPLGRAQALEDAAVLLAGAGDLPAARRAFTGAAGLYRALGAVWDLRRGRCPAAPPRHPPRPGRPAGTSGPGVGGAHPDRGEDRLSGHRRAVQRRHRRRAVPVPQHRANPRVAHPGQARRPVTRRDHPPGS